MKSVCRIEQFTDTHTRPYVLALARINRPYDFARLTKIILKRISIDELLHLKQNGRAQYMWRNAVDGSSLTNAVEKLLMRSSKLVLFDEQSKLAHTRLLQCIEDTVSLFELAGMDPDDIMPEPRTRKAIFVPTVQI